MGASLPNFSGGSGFPGRFVSFWVRCRLVIAARGARIVRLPGPPEGTVVAVCHGHPPADRDGRRRRGKLSQNRPEFSLDAARTRFTLFVGSNRIRNLE